MRHWKSYMSVLFWIVCLGIFFLALDSLGQPRLSKILKHFLYVLYKLSHMYTEDSKMIS